MEADNEERSAFTTPYGQFPSTLKGKCIELQGEAFFIETQCVVHKNIVTANATSTLEFSREILELLDIKLPVEIDDLYSHYKQGEFLD